MTSRSPTDEHTSEPGQPVFHRSKWTPAALDTRRPREGAVWLVFCDAGEVAKRVICTLQSRVIEVRGGQEYRRDGDRVELLIDNAGDYERLITDVVQGERLSGILHFWSYDVPATASDAEGHQILTAQERSTQSALLLLQSLVRAQLSDLPDLWFCTCSGTEVGASAMRVEQTGLSGLVRVARNEVPKAKFCLLDLCGMPSDIDIAATVSLLTARWPGNEFAIRDGCCFERTLAPGLPKSSGSAGIRVRPDATFVISGGLGGLGLHAARELVDRGAKHLLLCGRTGAAAVSAREGVEDLQKYGVEVRVAAVDVTDYDALRVALRDAEETMPPIGGVIHAAGVVDDGAITDMNFERMHRVLAPKIAGGWNLHLLTQDYSLDFFIAYSSVSAEIGIPGQANYATANAFLEGLAARRRTAGKPALAVNWGWISDAGHLDRIPEAIAKLKRMGVQPMAAKEMFPAMDRALLSGLSTVTVAEIGPRKTIKEPDPLERESAADRNRLEELLRIVGEMDADRTDDN